MMQQNVAAADAVEDDGMAQQFTWRAGCECGEFEFRKVDAFDNLLQANEIYRSVYLIQIAFADAELLQ